MDPIAVDRLTRTFATAGTRRRLVALLGLLPLASTPPLSQPDPVEAGGRRHRHKRRHHPGGDKRQRKGKHNGKQKGRHQQAPPPPPPPLEPSSPPPSPPCVPVSQTACAAEGRACGPLADGCGGTLDCGSCGLCQTCTSAGQCVADPAQNRTTCAGSGTATSVCCNGECCAGCCGHDGACGACRVFTTSQKYDGNLKGSSASGLEGADATCQQLAGSVNPPLPGTYQAWLSDSISSPSTRFRCTQASCSTEGYVLVDGTTVVATDWIDLTTCSGSGPLGPGTTDCLDHAIDHTELNGPLGSQNNVWTYTNTDGTAGGIGNGNCLDWSSNDSTQKGSGGLPVAGHGDITWTRFQDSSDPCNTIGFRLYCFQQS